MSPVVFEPTMSAGKRPQTYALDRGANGIGSLYLTKYLFTINRTFVIVLLINLFNITTGCLSIKKKTLCFTVGLTEVADFDIFRDKSSYFVVTIFS